MTSAGKVLREGAMIVGPVVWIEELGSRTSVSDELEAVDTYEWVNEREDGHVYQGRAEGRQRRCWQTCEGSVS